MESVHSISFNVTIYSLIELYSYVYDVCVIYTELYSYVYDMCVSLYQYIQVHSLGCVISY